ncbi:hypothetical protein JCM9279_000063 [Rhodotorula babjevae]
MHPPLTARPRPPARRTTSKSTLTALPTPSTPRRRRSQLDSSTTDGTHTGGDDDSWGRASGQRASLGSSSSSAQPRPAPAARPPLASSSRRGASGRSTLDELDTPPSSTPIAPEPSHAATSSRNKPSVLPVPFPSADDDPFAPAPSSSSPAAAQHDLAHGDSAGLGIDDGDTTINIDALRGLSREELAHMLQEADRIIRDKEQELSTFTAAGEELLNEFNSLRQRHESLAGRTSATPVRASPQRSSRNSTISAATSSPVADGKRRAHSSWRVSLGLPPPSGTLGEVTSTPGRRDRLSSAASYRMRDASSDISPSATFRFRAASSVTPEASPTSTRRDAPAGQSRSPLNGNKALLSPGAAAHDLASLSQVNYALTLQLSDLHAGVEETEREGRKRLRKLERELQAVREDLERAEQRNALLETEVELVKERENELARSTRVGPTPRKPASAPLALDRYDEASAFDWRVRPAPRPDSLDDDDGGDDVNKDDSSPVRNFGPPTPLGRTFASDAIFAHQPTSPPAMPFPSLALDDDDGFLGTSFAAPSRRDAVVRSVSTSSLAPLPLPMQLDPSLDRQADELVDQLINKIDELEKTNLDIALEREQMEHRLAMAQEEVDEWKERCDELVEGNAVGRLEWDGPKGAITWHSDDDDVAADADTDDPLRARRSLRPHRITRRSRLLTQTADTPMSLSSGRSGLFSGSISDHDSASPDTSPVFSKRTLEHELGDDYEPERHGDSLAHDIESVSSVVVRSDRPRTRRSRHLADLFDPAEHDSPITTADDLLPLGSLRWAGPPEAETYAELEHAADNLVPAWADDDHLTATSSSSRCGAQLRLGDGGLWDEPDVRARRAKGGKTGEGRTGGKGKGKAASRSALENETEYEERDAVARQSASQTRRRHALRRLGREASTRSGLEVVHHAHPASDDSSYNIRRRYRIEDALRDDESDISSTYDELDHPLTRTADYYPVALRSRYHPRMLATMMTDSAVQHLVTLVTWIQFLVVLGMALGFALWQGPKKTFGLVDGRRRLR